MMRLAPLAILAVVVSPALADEGMWTFDHFPSETVKEKYGFAPDASWLEKVRGATLRLPGCSGSFVSPEGLILTNYHCAERCVERLSSSEHDLLASGFLAATRAEEPVCPGMSVDRLVEIRDVTSEIEKATEGLEGAAFLEALRGARSKLEHACAGEDTTRRCDVVSLYEGGLYHLYRYERYAEVRLAFAPEFATGFFGGDPDNFRFPRWNLDAAILRAYRDGKPARTPDFFPFSTTGAKEGDLVFVPGNPGSTSRLDTVAQLEYQRDVVFPARLPYLTEKRGVLWEFASTSDEADRVSRGARIYLDNGIKVFRNEQKALLDPRNLDAKRVAETELRARVDADPALKAKFGGAWDAIAKALAANREIADRERFVAGTSGFDSDLFDWARTIVRGTVEREKPAEARLPEYAPARIPRVEQGLFAARPVDRDLEATTLAFSLERLREALGPDDPLVKKVLGPRSPREAARAFVAGSKLDDPAVRRSLWDAGAEAVEASDDAMIRLALSIDPESRALRKRVDDEVDSVIAENRERVARARFAVYGTSVYPDATFSPRLSYGAVSGWTDGGTKVEPYTRIEGLYRRATGREPYALPESWKKAEGKVDGSVPFDFVTTNDIVGGSSGSPVVDRNRRLVGLAFDGNLESIANDYFFDAEKSRMVAVDSRAILEALEKVYGAAGLAKEIREAAGN